MDDLFAFITEQCHMSVSQEERLRHCSFAPGHNEWSDEDPDYPTQPLEMEVESTPIVMVSLPVTPEEEKEKRNDSTP